MAAGEEEVKTGRFSNRVYFFPNHIPNEDVINFCHELIFFKAKYVNCLHFSFSIFRFPSTIPFMIRLPDNIPSEEESKNN